MSYLNSIRPVLLQKWTQMFYFCDINNDGIHTMKDYEATKRRLMKCNDLTMEKRVETNEMFYDMWTEYMEDGALGSVTLETWLSKMKAMRKTGDIVKFFTQQRSRYFSCFDLNADGFIDFREYRIMASISGRTELPYVDVAFMAMDIDRDGLISRDEYIYAYLKYVMDPAVKIETLPLYGLPAVSMECRC